MKKLKQIIKIINRNKDRILSIVLSFVMVLYMFTNVSGLKILAAEDTYVTHMEESLTDTSGKSDNFQQAGNIFSNNKPDLKANLNANSGTSTSNYSDTNTSNYAGTNASNYAGGNGTFEEPYQISTKEQFSNMVTSGSREYFILLSDININGNYSAYTFYGNLDGRGHKLTGVTSANSAGDNGLFGCLAGSISNMYVYGTISTTGGTSGTHSGIIAGISKSGSQLTNVIVDGSVTGSQTGAGGYVVCGGAIGEGTCIVKYCASNVAVSSTATSTAGSYASDFIGNALSGSSVTCSYVIGGSRDISYQTGGHGKNEFFNGTAENAGNVNSTYSVYVNDINSYIEQYSTSAKPLVKWTTTFGKAMPYSVTYYGNGGSGTVDDMVSYGHKANVILKNNAFTRTGYDFKGWGTSALGNVTNEAGTTFTITSNQAFYAIWESGKYNAIFNGINITAVSGFGSNTAAYGMEWSGTIKPSTGYHNPDTITVKVGSETLSSDKYSYNAANGNIQIAGEYVTGEVSVSADGIVNKYNIFFHGNGGTIGDTYNTEDIAQISYGTAYEAPTVKIMLDGWTFLGWSKKVNAVTADTELLAGKDLSKLTTIDGASIDLYAVWQYKDGTYPTSLQNGSFEDYQMSAWTGQYNASWNNGILKWKTTASDNKIELAKPSNNPSAVLRHYGVTQASDGLQFAELNATQVAALYQVVATIPGSTLHWGLDHRSRVNDTEEMVVWIGEPVHVSEAIDAYKKDGNKIGTKTQAVLNRYSDIKQWKIADGKNEWVNHTGEYVVPDGQTTTTFAFVSLMEPSNTSLGNLLDNVYFSTTVPKKKTQVIINGSDGGTTVITAVDGSKTLVRESDIYNENLEYGDVVTIEPAEKEGYSFIGAYVDGRYITENDFNKKYVVGDDMPSSMTMIYAKDRTVSLVLNGGTLKAGEKLENTLSAAGTTIYTISEPERMYYNFTGWNIVGTDKIIDAGCKVIYEIDNGITHLRVYDKDRTDTIKYDLAGDTGIILYAVWEVDLSEYSEMTIFTNNNIADASGVLISETVKQKTLVVNNSDEIDYYTFEGISMDGYKFIGWTYDDAYVLHKGDVIKYSTINGTVKITFPSGALDDYRAAYNAASEEVRATLDDYYLSDDALTITSPEAMTFYAKLEAIQANTPIINENVKNNLSLEFGYITGGNELRVMAETKDTQGNEILGYQWYQVILDENGIETETVIKIEGATENVYVIPTDIPIGTYGYYCKITATNRHNGLTAGIDSVHSKVTVKDTRKPMAVIYHLDKLIGDTFITNGLKFNDFFNTDQIITIEAKDEYGSGIDENRVYFYIDTTGSTTAKSMDELNNVSWKKYNDSTGIVLSDNGKYVIYAKVSDLAGNTVIINSNGIVIDKIAPVTSLTEDNYKGKVLFKVIEENTDTIMIDGKPAVAKEDGTFLLVRKDESYLIEIRDKAGNTYSKTVTIDYADITIPVIQDKDYTGALQKADVQEKSDYTVTTNEGGTDVGAYDVIFTLNDIENTRWMTPEEGSYYVIDEINGTLTMKFTINKVNNCFINELICKGFTYDGKKVTDPKTMSKFGNDKLSFTYYLDRECTKKTTTSDGAAVQGGNPSNAGVYYVKATVPGTDNYENLESNPVKFEISKAGWKSPEVGYTDVSYAGNKDGTIKIIMAGMEWTTTPDIDDSWKKVTDAQILSGMITGLGTGTYYIRYEADRNHYVGDVTKVTIDTKIKIPEKEFVVKPVYTVKNYDTVIISGIATDGEYTIIEKSFSYRKLGSSIWITIPIIGNEVKLTGLSADTVYELRINAKDSHGNIITDIQKFKTQSAGEAAVGNKQTAVEINDGAPDVTADGLDNIFNASFVKDNKEIKDALNNGGTVEICLIASMTTAENSIVKLNNKAAAGEKKIGMMVDLDVNMVVVLLDGKTLTSSINDTEKLILIKIPMADSIKGKNGYQIYRVHNGDIQTLTELVREERKNPEKEGFYMDGDNLYIAARYFSSYALAYDTKSLNDSDKPTDQNASTDSDSTTGAGDSLNNNNEESKDNLKHVNCNWHWCMLLLMAAYILFVIIGKDKPVILTGIVFATDIILTIILVIFGTCKMDIPFAIGTLLFAGATVPLKHLISKEDDEEEDKDKDNIS